MKSTRKTLGRVLALALVVIMALTTAIPAYAANTNPNTENLTITIHNNEGLPELTENSFDVYQLFTGTPYKEEGAKENDWDASEWNNWSLADIGWGASVKKDNTSEEVKDGYDHSEGIINGLKGLTKTTAAWAFANETTNPFEKVATAEDVARVLEKHTDNLFLQGFATWLLDNSHLTVLASKGEVNKNGTPDDYSDDTLTYKVPGTGYYLFAEKATYDAKIVSEYIFAVMGHQDIDLKASIPNVDKNIVVGDTDKKGDADGVGEVVTFKLTGTLPKNFNDYGTYYYEFFDKLSEGLSLNTDSFVIKAEVGTDTYTIDRNEYGIIPTGALLDPPPAGGTTIVITFSDLHGTQADGTKKGLAYTAKNDVEESGFITLTPDSKIIVTYTATVNENAVIGSEGNPNDVHLVYSNNPNHDGRGQTEDRRVYVYAFGLDLVKIASDTQEGLPGAGFTLKNSDGKYAHFIEKKDKDGNVIGRAIESWVEAGSVENLINAYYDAVRTYESAPNDEMEAAKAAVAAARAKLDWYLLVSDDKGELPDVYGLGDGTYTLTEVVTPAGYNTMLPFEFTITADIDDLGILLKVTYKHDDEEIVYKPSYDNGEIDGDTDGTIADDLIARFKTGLLADTLVNEKAPLLPFTGGMGTVIFYVTGSLMIAGAVIYLVIAIRRRRSEENSAE